MTPPTVDRVCAELRRYSYKPGWQFVFEQNPSSTSDTYILTATYLAPDSYNPETRTTVSSVEYISALEFMAVGDWRRALRWRLERLILRLETHERQEWFKYDGVLLTDPHAEDPPAINP